jgi:hypothetical protein
MCADFFQRIGPMLHPGKNLLDLRFTLDDGTNIAIHAVSRSLPGNRPPPPYQL